LKNHIGSISFIGKDSYSRVYYSIRVSYQKT